MKILSCNTGYFLGFEKPLPDYLLNLKRSCIGSKRIENTKIDQLVEAINREDPDIVTLQEVDQGSIRTRTSGQVRELKKRISNAYSQETSVKYGPGKLISRLPIFGKMSNAILSRSNGDVRQHFISPGSKQLLMEYQDTETGYSVFNAHMPTVHRYRAQQLKKIKQKILDRENAVLCGDFNCYHGKSELEELFRDTEYRVESPGPTHPRSAPHRELNLFVVPENLELSVRRIEDKVSDHYPVIADISGF